MIRMIDTNEVLEPVEFVSAYFQGNGSRSTLVIDRLLDPIVFEKTMEQLHAYKCLGFPSLNTLLRPEDFFEYFWTFHHGSNINFVEAFELSKEIEGKDGLVFAALCRENENEELIVKRSIKLSRKTMDEVIQESVKRTGAIKLTVINVAVY